MSDQEFWVLTLAIVSLAVAIGALFDTLRLVKHDDE